MPPGADSSGGSKDTLVSQPPSAHNSQPFGSAIQHSIKCDFVTFHHTGYQI